MAVVVIYTTLQCPYCDRAKSLLSNKGIAFEEIRVDTNEKKRVEMMERSGRRTVPQIFINDQSIGGFDALWALEQQGKLDQLLNQ